MQLNEIWPTGGWGSLEYGTVGKGFTKGQVKGGRWKPLQYWFKSSLFADVIATCGTSAGPRRGPPGPPTCYVRNDRADQTFEGQVALTTFELNGNGSAIDLLTVNVSLPAGLGAMHWFPLPQNELPPRNSTALISTVTDVDGKIISSHMIQLAQPKDVIVSKATISVEIANSPNADGSIDIAVKSDKVALFVTLTSLAQGRFSDNAFFLPATTKTVQFIPFLPLHSSEDMAMLKATLRVEDHSAYL